MKEFFLNFFFFVFKRYVWIYLLGFSFLFSLALRQPFKIDLATLGTYQYSEGQVFAIVEGLKEPDAREYARANNYYEQVLAILPDLDYAYGNMGFCYFQLGDLKKAIQCYNQAIRLNPRIYTYFWDRGMIFFQLKQYQKAVEDLEEAIRVMPSTEEFYRGIIRQENLESDRSGNVSYYFFSFLQSVPDDQIMAEMHLARSYFFLKDWNKLEIFFSRRLPGLAQEGDLLSQRALIKGILFGSRQYDWSQRVDAKKLHFHFFLGPFLVKKILLSRIK